MDISSGLRLSSLCKSKFVAHLEADDVIFRVRDFNGLSNLPYVEFVESDTMDGDDGMTLSSSVSINESSGSCVHWMEIRVYFI